MEEVSSCTFTPAECLQFQLGADRRCCSMPTDGYSPATGVIRSANARIRSGMPSGTALGCDRMAPYLGSAASAWPAT